MVLAQHVLAQSSAMITLGSLSGFGPNMIMLATAISAGAVVSAFISLALWEMVYRARVNANVVHYWREQDQLLKTPGLFAHLFFAPKYFYEMERLIYLPPSAFDLTPSGLAAQAAARLQAVAELAPAKIRPFLVRAANLFDVEPTDLAQPRPRSSPEAAPPSDLAIMIDRAVDDLHARLTRAVARTRYAMNIAIGVILAWLVSSPHLAAANLQLGSEAVWTLFFQLTSNTLAGVMAGLVGVVVQGWLMRTSER